MKSENSKSEDKSNESVVDLIDEEFINDFLKEASEGFQQVEVDFVTLEKEPQNTDLINNIFRVIHSLKGASSFLGFKNLESVSHKTEDVLNKLRKTELNLNSDVMDILLDAVDTIKLILHEMEDNKTDTAVNTEDIKNRLDNIITESQNPEIRNEKSEMRNQK
ncbi:MAG: hypothetical protein GY777_14035 [Candidatus Brocadiaceae bacterium]|nr:hypothetical protein [Candidatus Brocadiaceae bacterium]